MSAAPATVAKTEVTKNNKSAPTTHRVWVNAVSGATGSVLAKTLLAPIQRVVIMQQLGDNKYLSARQVAAKILKEEGPRGFLRGNFTSALQRIPYGGIQLAVYDQCKDLVMKVTGEHAAEQKRQQLQDSSNDGEGGGAVDKDLLHHLKGLFSKAVAGGLAASFSGSAVYPLEVIRTRLMSGDIRYRTISGTFRQIWKETNGPRNLYRGLNASLLQRCPDIMINFVVFETIKFEMLEKGYSNTACIIAGGGSAALASIACTFPLDMAKRRIAMANQLKSGIVYKGTADFILRTIKTDGVSGLYAGAKLDAVRCVPQVILMWYFIEQTRMLLNRHF